MTKKTIESDPIAPVNKDEKLPTSHSPLSTNNAERYFFRASAADFKKIPGCPIAYWASERIKEIFTNQKIGDITISDGQTKTGDNDKYLRMLWEVDKSNIGKHNKWVKHPKGGSFRRWYGNLDTLIDWSESSRMHYRKDRVARILPDYLWWEKGFCWTLITSGAQSFRIVNDDEIFNLAAPTLFPNDNKKLAVLLGLVNTSITSYITKLMNPTLNMNVGDIQNIPIVDINEDKIGNITELLVKISASDWDAYETSWDFTSLPLLHPNYRQPTLKASYQKLRVHWQEMTLEMQRLEQENNRIFIEAYGLQDELTPEVPLNEITLTCNPYYRYGKKVENGEQEVGSDGEKTFPFDPELEERLLADTMKEFLSYAVGCMFGRYSLDAPGLILANQGDGLEDYIRIIEEKVASGQGLVASENQNLATSHQPLTTTFEPDADNVIPILGDNWFTDDIVERFQRFLRVTFGDEHYEENLKFIEKAIGKSIRKYFLKDFYKDHVKTYKKRPIYWLFSSPKGNFNALIYMHRYRPDTVSVILNDYLREFRTKLVARKEHLEKVSISATADNREKTQALKETEKLAKIIDELNAYETSIYNLATQNIEIDLDDGVKTNYPKFGNTLRKIPGLS